VSDPTRPIDLTPKRERVLAEVLRSTDQTKNIADPRQVTDLFNRTAFVANKANVLAKAIEEVARRYEIPVHPDADEVRAAVKRKSSDSPDGLKISFDLFKDAVEVMHRRQVAITELTLNQAPDDPGVVFQKKIIRLRNRLAVPEGDLTDDELELLLSHFFILLMAYMLQGAFDAIDHALFVAVIPDGQPAEAVIAFQVILSVVVQLIMFAANEQQLEKWLDDASLIRLPAGMTGAKVIQAAKAQPIQPIHRLAAAYAGFSDYETILRYAFEYLQRTEKPGYEMWIGYVDATNTRLLAQTMWTRAPSYSAPHALQSIEPVGKRRRRRRTQSGGDDEGPDVDLPEGDVKQLVLSSLVPMGVNNQEARLQALDGLSQHLDLVAQVLSTEFLDEAICCLARFLVKLPVDQIKVIRAIIQALLQTNIDSTVLDLGALLGKLLNYTFIELTATELIYLAERFFNELVGKLLGIFGDDIVVLFCCPLIKELVESVLRVLVDIENKILDLLRQFTFSIRIQIDLGRQRYFLLNDKRYGQQLIMILDRVVQIIEQIEVCGEANSDEAINRRLVDEVRAMEGLPRIGIESWARTHYFVTADTKEGNEKRIIPALGRPISGFPDFESSVGDPAGAGSNEDRDLLDALKDVPGAVEAGATEGYRNLASRLGLVDPVGGQEADRGPQLSLCYRLFSELDVKKVSDAIKHSRP